MSLIDFLSTTRSKAELKAAYDALMDFKACEGAAERLHVPYDCWIKLEQFEEYLNHLVNGAPLQEDTAKAMDQAGIVLPATEASPGGAVVQQITLPRHDCQRVAGALIAKGIWCECQPMARDETRVAYLATDRGPVSTVLLELDLQDQLPA